MEHFEYIDKASLCMTSPKYIRKKRLPISHGRKNSFVHNRMLGESCCVNKLKDLKLSSADGVQRRNSLPKVADQACRSNGSFSSDTELYFIEKTAKNPLNNFEKFVMSSTDAKLECHLNVETISKHSSSSTIRERHNSQDSAFSQYSMIDVKEEAESLSEQKKDRIDNGSSWRPHHTRSRSDVSLQPSNCTTEPSEMPHSLPRNGTKRKSIFEGQPMIVPTECFFPRPHEGQSITSFLSSTEFSISAELDRENAHFCISDALISAIEHMKCSRTKQVVEVIDDDESDEEIRKLSQRIRIRRRERQREKVFKNMVLLSDGRTDTTSQSASPPLSSHSSDFDVDSMCSEDEVEDLELSTNNDTSLSSMKENGLSLSMASLYSEADIHKAQAFRNEAECKKHPDSDSANLTAESVALSLLRKFSEKHLPKASDLQWLVSEQEAPQRLLPLPDSWPVSPDIIEEEYNMSKTRLRGNLEWAPPRPQIIFFIHPYMKRREIIERQKFRCAGCGMKIEKNYINRFRYCEYFGKYFCQCCHGNNQAHIPGRILFKWDFSKYYVSKFAFELIDQMFTDPLFNIEDINCNLYNKARQLDSCRYYRMQLFYLKDFIRTCRKAETIQFLFEKEPSHIITDPHAYSLCDLLQVKSGELGKRLSQLIGHCLYHIRQCILCQAKGFVCEICQKDSDIIFPFQFDRVLLCQKCGSCFHKRCSKNIECPKCKRIQERRRYLAESKSEDELCD